MVTYWVLIIFVHGHLVGWIPYPTLESCLDAKASQHITKQRNAACAPQTDYANVRKH